MSKFISYIETLNSKLYNSIYNIEYPIGLFYGKMGLCIYYYELSLLNKKYSHKADILMSEIIEALSLDLSIGLENGLSGVGMGVSYLMKKGFLEGNVNSVLECIDSKIDHHLLHSLKLSINQKKLFFILVYLIKRYEENKSKLNEELLIHLFEHGIASINLEFFKEPLGYSFTQYLLPLYLVISGKFIENEINTIRVINVYNSLKMMILRQHPIFQGNKIYLLYGLISLYKQIKDFSLEKMIQQLSKEISIQQIIKEFGEYKMFLSSGLMSVVLMLCKCKDVINGYASSDINIDVLISQVDNKRIWERLCNDNIFFQTHTSFIDGFPGIITSLINLNNEKRTT